MKSSETVPQALQDLQQRGYRVDTECCRVEGASDPAHEAIVYGLEARSDLKGMLVNGYGNCSDSLSPKLEQKLHFYLEAVKRLETE